ncbi:MAG: hypothetical protein HY885_07660 [Deltaproteobacteria bacterium]|nr:hypothetical protein [Deltaproteobacteria bacterium]
MNLEYLQQKEWQKFLSEELPTTPWITVYKFNRDGKDDIAIFSGIIPLDKIKKSLETDSWDISIGEGHPGFVTYFSNGEEDRTEYKRNLNDLMVEPVVICREFNGMKENYLEIQEEFRLYHNLYKDPKRDVYVKIYDDGNEEDAVVIENKQVKIRTKLLKNYIAAKQMALAIYFENFRYSTEEFTEDEYHLHSYDKRDENFSFSLHIGPWSSVSGDNNKTISVLLGKRIILPPPFKKSGRWPFEERNAKFEDFIIGTDEEGEHIFYTSNPGKLANYFGANPGAPHFLTPVFFKKEVLTKYYNNPEKYSVEDGYLRCGGLWGLQMDNDHPDVVMVFLGYLGQGLFHSEQLYWKSYNIPPEGKISATCFKRSFMAQFADPTSEDLTFKSKFIQFLEKWSAKFGWPLFLPLNKDDSHLFTSLHVPVTNDHSEFDSQILAISKILIDSLNEKEIEKATKADTKELPGIAKFGHFLCENSLDNHENHIEFLKDLYALRSSGVGHRKGKRFANVAKRFSLDEKPLKEVFVNILNRAEEMLDTLEAHFFVVPHKKEM